MSQIINDIPMSRKKTAKKVINTMVNYARSTHTYVELFKPSALNHYNLHLFSQLFSKFLRILRSQKMMI